MPAGMVEASAVIAPPDVRGAGEMQWSTVSGMEPTSPLVGGPHVEGLGRFDVDRGRSRIVSIPGATDPATGSGAGAPGVELLDDWRDLFNFKGSPMPWLLLLALAALGFAQLSVAARVGPAKAAAGIG